MSAVPVTSEKPDTTSVRPSSAPVLTKEISEMLIYEELARARIQDMRRTSGRSRSEGTSALPAGGTGWRAGLPSGLVSTAPE